MELLKAWAIAIAVFWLLRVLIALATAKLAEQKSLYEHRKSYYDWHLDNKRD